MIRSNNINKFPRGCSDLRDQLFCLFELKKLPRPYGWSLGWKRFFNIISLAVWLGEDSCGRFRFVVRVIHGIGLLNVVSSLLFIVDYSGCIESCR